MHEHVFDPAHLPTLLIVGGAILAGSLGARVFQKLRIPQVVGYIAIGALIGKSGLKLIGDAQIRSLLSVNFVALGIIGFMIGGELHLQVFKKYGRQFFAILFAEGLTAFVLVGLLVTALTYGLLRDASTAIAFGLVLGAIASATAPAATVDVLWEYKTRGVLTTTVLAIVALDDGLALVLYSLASGGAMLVTGGGASQLGESLLHTGYELGGALVLGVLSGLGFNQLLRRTHDYDKMLTFILGVLTLVLGLSLALKVDLILAAMALGMTLVNLAPHRSREAFDLMGRFAAPIYVVFFVFVGARLSVRGLPGWMWVIAIAYVIGRTAGKMTGAWAGAKWSGAPESVRKYLGLCLFSQAGVAIGLAILASIRFSGIKLGGVVLGDAIVMIVTTTTFLVQIIGPPCVKLAVKWAGEIGLDVTEQDLVNSYTVRDALNAAAPTFMAQTSLKDVLRTIAETDARAYPVLTAEGQIAGLITMDDLKYCFANPSMVDWLVAADVMRMAPETTSPDTPLADALQHMQQQGFDCLPVTEPGGQGRYQGLLESRGVKKMISQEVLRRRAQGEA